MAGLSQVHRTGAILTGARHAKRHAMRPYNDLSAVPTGQALTSRGLDQTATAAVPSITP